MQQVIIFFAGVGVTFSLLLFVIFFSEIDKKEDKLLKKDLQKQKKGKNRSNFRTFSGIDYFSWADHKKILGI